MTDTDETAQPKGQRESWIKRLEGYARTLEVRLFGGKLHQKWVANAPNAEPAHHWVDIEEHSKDAESHEKEAADLKQKDTDAAAGKTASTDLDETAALKAQAAAQAQPPVRYGDDGPIPTLQPYIPATGTSTAGGPLDGPQPASEGLVPRTAALSPAPGYEASPITTGTSTGTVVSAGK